MVFSSLIELKSFLDDLSPSQLEAKLAMVSSSPTVPTGHVRLSVEKVGGGPFVFQLVGSTDDL